MWARRRLTVGLSLSLRVGAICMLIGCAPEKPSICNKGTCPTGSRTYQACINWDDSATTYEFGSMSCTVATGNSTELTNCTDKVNAYCAGGSAGAGGS